jgi:siderophore synthetase component/RimJ/RimL family protein N-acetyltransferase
MTRTLFARFHSGHWYGLRNLDPDADAELLHRWVTHPKAAFWMMRDADVATVRREYRAIIEDPHRDAFVGTVDGEPAFLVERYDPAHVELAGLFQAQRGDVGMHFLCAPADTPLHGFTRAVLGTILAWLFADPEVGRVVVEPDVRNTAVHALNKAAGFEPVRTITKPEKEALLSVCTRARFETMSQRSAEQDAVSHLTPRAWAAATRMLIRKALAEFAHERLITPEPAARPGRYTVRGDDGTVEYRFAARLLALDHWLIDADGITRHRGDVELPLDAVDFCLEFSGSLRLSEQVLPVYLEEITATLAGRAYRLGKPHLGANELVKAGFQVIETAMTEGHPCFVANSGRLGFGIDDYHAYAPETANPVRLLWLAAHRDHATFTGGDGIDYASFIRAELGEEVLARFADTMERLGLSLTDYFLIPVHPWQWWNKLSMTFAGEVAGGRLVCLGPGDDEYLAQQSVRTFFNVGAPAKHYVKTALSVVNMGFLRGLSTAYMAATPAINDWLADLVARDEILRSTRLTVLRECAAVGYRHRQYEAATGRYSPYRKMLAALWRESPVPGLEPGRRLATMASLLHTDRDGRSFAAALVEESGLAPEVWLRHYLNAYLTPLLHCFYAYDLAFMPHGENVILVLDGGTVERAIFKDIAEEIVVMDPAVALPAAVRRIQVEVPERLRLLSIFTDVFDSFFRHLAAVLITAGVLDQRAFWRTVAECARDYQDRAPHLAAKFRRYDLFASEFPLSCLNRLQLRDNRQMIDLADPGAALQFAGSLRNPLAGGPLR